MCVNLEVFSYFRDHLFKVNGIYRNIASENVAWKIQTWEYCVYQRIETETAKETKEDGDKF